MSIVRRIYVSLPADPWLHDNLNRLKWGIVEEIEKLGYTLDLSNRAAGRASPLQGPGTRAPRSRSPADVTHRGLGMQRWRFTDSQGKEALLPTEFNHYEGALFHTLRLPRSF